MKNLAKYRHEEAIGTSHWFRTLISEQKRCLDGLSNDTEEFKKNHKHWLEQAKNISLDIIEWNNEGNFIIPPDNDKKGIFIGNKYYSEVDIEALSVIAKAYHLLVNK